MPPDATPPKPPLSVRLRQWRAAHGLGRKAGAEELGVSKRTLQDWEQARRTNPYYETIEPVLRRLERDGF